MIIYKILIFAKKYLMKIIHITIIIVILITSNACSDSSILTQLQLADSIISDHPDSALKVLNELSIEKMPNKANKAMYALLLTQALDKNYIHHTSDSLISIAVDFYKNSNHNNLKVKVYFYLGRVYQDNEEYVKAT